MTHTIKLDLLFCDAVLSGAKSYEIRQDDRDYRVGDLVRFVAVDGGAPATHKIASRTYKITYILRGWGLQPGYVAFALKEVGRVTRAYQCHICDKCDVDDVSDKAFCVCGYWPGCGDPEGCKAAFNHK